MEEFPLNVVFVLSSGAGAALAIVKNAPGAAAQRGVAADCAVVYFWVYNAAKARR